MTGVYCFEPFKQEYILNFCTELTKGKKSGKLLIYNYDQNEKIYFYDIKTKNLCDCNYEFVNYQEIINTLVKININFLFQLNFTFSENFSFQIKTAFEHVITNVDNDIFCLENSNFQMSGNEEVSNITIEELYNKIDIFDELADVQIPANMKKKMIEKYQKQFKSGKNTLKFRLKTDLENSSDSKIIKLEQNNDYKYNIDINLFYLLPLQNKLQQLQKLITSSLKKILQEMSNVFIELKEKESALFPHVLNFYEPTEFTHVISGIFNGLNTNEHLKNQRKYLHLKYLIPMTKPTFKFSNALDKNWNFGKKLTNVHLGLNSGIKNGQMELVKGKYIYYHYNQDHIDVGWGCAYRSLQTIISWFQLQGFIDIEVVPTHREIQQALIDIGDKPKNFLGSSKWIGSQEVCYVLNHLYGIQSKIIFINSATELSDKARNLLHHFSTNGTPVMIGGGVLAHTIIGIDFNESNGDVKFLVLDPHYVGEEDLSNIYKKVFKF